MGKICKVLREKDVGAIGIGAMIVFIAMVLVAGIAASVLVQTANTLQIQAMRTGQETTAEVATGLHVLYIDGKNNSGKIGNITITIKPRAGSNDIDLNKTVVQISDTTKKCVLGQYQSAFSTSVGASGVFSESAVFNLSGSQFGIIVLEDADGSCNTASSPVINRGDCVMITVNTSACFSGIDPRDDVWGEIIPEEGAPAVFSFRVPASLVDAIYRLY